ncbi:hypothetical protein E2C01_004374 [Portunus trituberculatus]|uniref:Uncharacterized protein n=1 Tax=Portunus trituberculatus TaxID=210409 RepID=A0A5B7CPT4_PORTR|nr:hypothetical protein [Portunus trituberculatus]
MISRHRRLTGDETDDERVRKEERGCLPRGVVEVVVTEGVPGASGVCRPLYYGAVLSIASSRPGRPPKRASDFMTMSPSAQDPLYDLKKRHMENSPFPNGSMPGESGFPLLLS